MAIEFSRDITFGQYLNLGSPVHRLDPRTKMLGLAVLMAVILGTRSLLGLAAVLIGAAVIQRVARVPLGYTLRGLRLLIGTLLILFVFQTLFFQAPPEQTLWRWWIIAFSWPGVLYGLLLLTRVLLLYHLTTLLMFTTPLIDLADGSEVMLGPLKRVGVPVNELVMTLVIALKFVPLLIAELERLIKAQTARGARFDRGNVFERARTLGATLIPLFVSALSRAEVLAVAMNARCYRGGQGRTKRRSLRFRRADGLAFGFVVLVAASALVLGRG